MKKAMTIDMTFERREELIREEEREEGIKEGQAEIMDLSKWLPDQDRSSDYWKAIEDPEYMQKLLEEYRSSKCKTNYAGFGDIS